MYDSNSFQTKPITLGDSLLKWGDKSIDGRSLAFPVLASSVQTLLAINFGKVAFVQYGPLLIYWFIAVAARRVNPDQMMLAQGQLGRRVMSDTRTHSKSQEGSSTAIRPLYSTNASVGE